MEDVENFYDDIYNNPDFPMDEKVFFFPHTPFNTIPTEDLTITETTIVRFNPLKYRDLFNEIESKYKCQINIFALNI